MNIRYQALLLILASTMLVAIVYLTLPFKKVPDPEPAASPVARRSWFNFNLFKKPEVKIIVTGDVMLGRTVMGKSLDLGDPKYPFLKVAERLWKADLTFVNLENPFVTNCRRETTSMVFCADPSLVEGLTYAGVDVVTLANNHVLNHGQAGLEETKSLLGQKGIAYVGLNNLVVKQVAGTKFGFLGFNFLDKNPKQADYELVKSARSQVDILLVSVHWGQEYKAVPMASQRKIAQELVTAGADVVVGHHPHWVQEMEYIDGKPVYYSLGNFVFDQMWSEKTREGLAVELIFQNKKLVGEEKLPIFMDQWAQPEWRR